ncbi:hypothetical protein J40TS1_00520 [Paenibacillus montaniterrae]|uniref:Uncharacterized protein n=1 Tax=Paenibacillus montaniterrae TaxID=429341 RepID=A0A919YJN2_9BACL|nr:hypothetical protein [Paenibacillus montaniterrae]GIP14410.1 hypothetical protein J40TS1_00520 [Paenibacillus montaniterrae]
MTIALTIKCNDGMVIAADSATTMTQMTPNGPEVLNIYDNAAKVFHLHKAIPVGAVTWGLGNIGFSSVSTLVKEFRKKITDNGDIKTESYTVEEITRLFYEFIYKEKYQNSGSQGSMGFVIGGYSSDSDLPEKWRIIIDEHGNCDGPELLADTNSSGAYWAGQPEALNRILSGFSFGLPEVLRLAGLQNNKIQEIIDLCSNHLTAPMVTPSMPIQDAIDLAEYLIDTTIKFVKYTPGHQTVGGPIEISVITRYEGFKWIKRKHFYDTKIN